MFGCKTKSLLKALVAGDSLPICPPLGSSAPTLLLGFWPALYRARAPGKGDLGLGQHTKLQQFGGFVFVRLSSDTLFCLFRNRLKGKLKA
jgi:hypothetical protein